MNPRDTVAYARCLNVIFAAMTELHDEVDAHAALFLALADSTSRYGIEVFGVSETSVLLRIQAMRVDRLEFAPPQPDDHPHKTFQ